MRRFVPLAVALAAYALMLGDLVRRSLALHPGEWVYPLDDAYIHMDIARNAALHHVWGVTRYEFTSSTSSPLWTALLAAGDLVFGVHDVTALVLAAVCGALVIACAWWALERHTAAIPVAAPLACLLGVVCFVPLPSLAMTGMEHVLHGLLTLAFALAAAKVLAAPREQRAPRVTWLLVLAPLLTASRYEGLFLVAMAALLLALRGRVVLAALAALAGAAPLAAYGAWSLSHGWFALPASVLLKGQMRHLSVTAIVKLLGYDGLSAFYNQPHLLQLLLAALVLLWVRVRGERAAADPRTWWLALFLGALMLHMTFARTGWFYRYEAYLVLFGLVAIGLSASEPLLAWFRDRRTWSNPARFVVALALVVVAVFPFAHRAMAALHETPLATRNIRDQQVTMGRFLARGGSGGPVIVNDIGAVAWLSDTPIVDAWGLGTLDVARMRLEGRYSTAALEQLARERGARTAILYAENFGADGLPALPAAWVRVGSWSIEHNVVVDGERVTFFATDSASAPGLRQRLNAFTPLLPSGVKASVEGEAP